MHVLVGAVHQGLQLAFGGFQVGLQGGVGLGVGLGYQGGQARTGQGGAVDLLVLAQVHVADALAVVEVRVVGVVAEAVVLVFGGVGFQGDLHALAGQFAEGQAAHAEEHLAQAGVGRFGFQLGAVVVGNAGFPLADHVFQVAHQQVGGGLQVGAAALGMTTGGAFADHVVGGGAVAGARAGAVQVLAPEEEFDGVVTGGDVGLGTAQLVQAGQFLTGDLGDVDLVFADLDAGVGDDVGSGAGVAQGVLVVAGDVVDQAFVQRPGVQLAFPIVDHRVAEAEHFGLHVGYAGGQPGFAGGFQGVGIGLGEEGVNGLLQVHGGAVGIGEDRQGEVGVVGDDFLGLGLVDLGGCSRGRGSAGGGRCGGLRCGGFLLVVTATGEGNGDGEQAGSGQGHTNHGRGPLLLGDGNMKLRNEKPPHNAKDFHFWKVVSGRFALAVCKVSAAPAKCH
ncbi:hypothetical protein D3C80_785140 [compost metagenome]